LRHSVELYERICRQSEELSQKDEMQLDIAEIMTRLPIAIEERHYTRLSALASNAHEPSICEYLREEFERPRIVSPTSWNPDRQPGQQGRIPRRTHREGARDRPSAAVEGGYRARTDLTHIGTAPIALSAN